MKKKSSFNFTLIGACLVSAAITGAVVYLSVSYWSSLSDTQENPAEEGHAGEDEHEHEEAGHEEGKETVVKLPKEMWEAAKLKVQPVSRQTVNVQTWATGKLTLNEDRSANIYSITEGRADEVPAKLGDHVKTGQTLAIIDSREVGTAQLDLYQARLQEKFAKQANDFAQLIKTNALQLIESLDQEDSPEQIEKKLGDKPIGKYREQLLGAYTMLVQARADYDRIQSVAETGAIAGKQVIQVEANLNTAKASFNAILEQLRFAVPHRCSAGRTGTPRGWPSGGSRQGQARNFGILGKAARRRQT